MNRNNLNPLPLATLWACESRFPLKSSNTRLGPYAYGFAFANRLIGYIKIPGMMELKPREGMPPLICPYKCTGDFEGGLHACSCKSQPICNSLVGHTALERLLYDAIIDAIADYIRNNQAAAYINDEKNAREPRNLSIPIPVIPLIPWRHHRDLAAGARTNRVFSDLLLVMGTTLDPHLSGCLPTVPTAGNDLY